MKKIYPIVEGRYRFLGGDYSTPKQLWELSVSGSYSITPSGEKDYLIRGASKLIMINEAQFKKYFTPFVDYFAEPEIIEEEGDVKPTFTREEKVNSPYEAVRDTFSESEGQLSLF